MSENAALTCQELVELVTDYLEDGLASEERLAFERHVAICPPCRGYLSQFRRIMRGAGVLREQDVPEHLRADVLAAFRDWKRDGAAG